MPISLRIPPAKEMAIRKAASKEGKTKTAYILEAIDEKMGTSKSREQTIRDLSGWLSHQEAKELRAHLAFFSKVNEEDWR